MMAERFDIAPRRGEAALRAEDACRVGIMRRIAAARLRHCGLEAMTDDVMLIVSELLTNALHHSGAAEISLKVAVRDGFLHISVDDGTPARIKPVPASAEAESGRGLALVAALAEEGGGSFGTSDQGATVWCRLAVLVKERP
jgi:signal transduction histidine kinase